MALPANFRAAMASQDIESLSIEQLFENHDKLVIKNKETLDNLRKISSNLSKIGGINKNLAMECFNIIEDFGAGRLKPNQYTSTITKTNFKLTMEELDAKRAGFIVGAIGLLLGLLAMAGNWIVNKLSGGSGGGTGGGGSSGSSDNTKPPTTDQMREAVQRAEKTVENIKISFETIVDDVEKMTTSVIPAYAELSESFHSFLFDKCLLVVDKMAVAKIASKDDPKHTEDKRKALIDKTNLLKRRRDELLEELKKRTEMNVKSLSGQDTEDPLTKHFVRDTKIFIKNTVFMDAMSNASGMFVDLVQRAESVLVLAELVYEEYDRLAALEKDQEVNWEIAENLTNFVNQYAEPNGPFGITFNGKKVLINQLFNQIVELEGAVGDGPIPDHVEIIKSIKANYLNDNNKASLIAMPALWEKLTTLQEKLDKVGKLSDAKINMDRFKEDSELSAKNKHKLVVDDVLHRATMFGRDALRVAMRILDHIRNYSTYVMIVTHKFVLLVIDKETLTRIVTQIKVGKSIVSEYKHDFGITTDIVKEEVPDYDLYFSEGAEKPLQDLIQEITATRHKLQHVHFNPESSAKSVEEMKKATVLINSISSRLK